MLTEFVEQNTGSNMLRTFIFPDIHVYRFSFTPTAANESFIIAPNTPDPHFEAFYCTNGAIHLKRTRKRQMTVNAQEILLVSGSDSIEKVSIEGPLEGVLVAADRLTAQDSLEKHCALVSHLHIDISLLNQRMEEHEGCVLLQKTIWSSATFATLVELDASEQGRFCMWKSVELLFLLCNHNHLLEPTLPEIQPDNYLSYLIVEICTYMKQHLDEPLTISALSHRFGISQTSLKKEFRRLYGKTIRTWLQEQRMELAAYLLRHSTMTVMSIAQECGYSSTSQFNTTFKNLYNCTPSQYRKNV